MAQWTKFNNPKKKKRRKRLTYSEACVVAGAQRIHDKKMGYEAPVEAYEDYAVRISSLKNK